jgi:hypothetical protein
MMLELTGRENIDYPGAGSVRGYLAIDNAGTILYCHLDQVPTKSPSQQAHAGRNLFRDPCRMMIPQDVLERLIAFRENQTAANAEFYSLTGETGSPETKVSLVKLPLKMREDSKPVILIEITDASKRAHIATS